MRHITYPVFTVAKCLDCGHDLPIRALYQFAANNDKLNPTPIKWLRADSSGLLRGKVGIECPQCGARFIITQWRIWLIRASTFLLLCVVVAMMGVYQRRWNFKLSGPEEALLLILFVALYFLVHGWSAWRFANVRRIRSGEIAGFPLERIYHSATVSKK